VVFFKNNSTDKSAINFDNTRFKHDFSLPDDN
jgi:hypothetical protein